jgi:hypothetical protein
MHRSQESLTLGRLRLLLFDWLTNPFSVLFDWIGYFLIFGAVVTMVLVIGAVVAIPLGLKLLGVAFAKTIVVETSKVLKDIGITNIDLKQQKDNEKMKAYLDRKIKPILTKVS